MSTETVANIAANALDRITHEDITVQRATDRRAVAVNDLAQQFTNLLDQRDAQVKCLADLNARLEASEARTHYALDRIDRLRKERDNSLGAVRADASNMRTHVANLTTDLNAAREALQNSQNWTVQQAGVIAKLKVETDRVAGLAVVVERQGGIIDDRDKTIASLRGNNKHLSQIVREQRAALAERDKLIGEQADAIQNGVGRRPLSGANAIGTLTGDCDTDMETLAADETQIRFTTGSAERMVIVPAGCVVTVERA